MTPDMAENLDIDIQNPSLGPGDTSDSGSDVPPAYRGRDSDSRGTGDRAGVDPLEDEVPIGDIVADRPVDADEAGVSDSAPDPVGNGG
ncbi:MAG: hypothetical protein JHC61_12810 [Burkholderiaceae bacterium]|nr:hypothetical protein [Burkholderiaceae bacterium]